MARRVWRLVGREKNSDRIQFEGGEGVGEVGRISTGAFAPFRFGNRQGKKASNK